MSALFGKKDFRRDLENLIKKGDIKGACDYALKNASFYEELGNLTEAENILKTLVELLEENKINAELSCIEVAIERLVSINIELQEVEKVIENSIKLARLKIELGKVNEAVQLIKMVDLRYKLGTKYLREILDIYISISHYPNALRIIERILEKEHDPKLIRVAGDILYNMGNFEKAYEYFKALSVLEPDNEYITKKVAELEKLLSTINKPKAVEVLQKESNEPQKVEEVKKEETAKEEVKQFQEVKSQIEIETPKLEKAEEKPKEEEQKVEVVQEKPKEEVVKKEVRKDLESIKEYMEALSYIEKGDIKTGIKLLETLALDYETKDIDTAIEIYEKILLIDPTSTGIAKRVAKILLDLGRTKEAIFYLRSAANSPDKESKLDVLLTLKELLKDDIQIRRQIFNTYLELNNTDEAIKSLEWFSNDTLNEALEKLYDHISNDVSKISRVAKLIKNKKVEETIKFKYFYRAFELYLKENDKIESIKYLIQSHSLKRLPLEDYLKVAEFLKEVKLPEETEIIAQAIFSYLEIENDIKKQFELSNIIISLGVNKPLYFAKHLELSKKLGIQEVTIEMAKRLVSHNAIQYAELVYDGIKDGITNLDTDFLNKLATYFELANLMNISYEMSLEILKRDPYNSHALTKTFLYAVEKENEEEILAFLERFPPNTSYANVVEPLIEKYKSLQVKAPFEYSYHFIIGFLYFFIERYEEAIASFQFVVRSNHHKGFMKLMLGICFERTLLLDFAAKQFELGLSEEISPGIRKELLYRYALLKKNAGDIKTARQLLTELLKYGDYKDAKIILEALPDTNKIIDIRGDER